MEINTASVAAVSASVSLKLHKGKTKVLKFKTKSSYSITLDGETLEDVESFTYLGSIIDEQGGSDADVKAWIGKARVAFLQLKNIWNSKQISTNTKVTIFNTNIKTVRSTHGKQCAARMQLDVLYVTNHLAPLPHTHQKMQVETYSVVAASTSVGLNIHKGKSKIMKCNTENTNLTTLDGETLKYVKSFTYLVSIFDEQGGSESDVNARTGKARSNVIQLKNMWNSKQVSANTKVLMIHRDVKTVLLCGAGTRRTKNMLRQELGADMKTMNSN
ncbi:unnamed protein product [Schistosoma curassoni]|uniref:DUF6451 domain-containing protein n=1 Tax=Schistosoma curassoni TaxID=6186 RepID=A0A183JDC9_9TREM|nr:unnamed protein product [Schistosoma curassoni]